MLETMRCVGENSQFDQMASARFERTRRDEFISAFERRGLNSHQIDSRPLASGDALRVGPLRLEPAYPNRLAGGQKLQRLAYFRCAPPNRAGDHSALTLGRKRAVDWHAEERFTRPPRRGRLGEMD